MALGGGTIAITLTYPPSANRLWRAVNGRQIKSAEYRAWLLENQQIQSVERRLAGLTTVPTIDGAYSMLVVAVAPDKRRRDLDNLLKPVGDLIQQLGLVADDANCRALSAAWDLDGPSGLRVILSPMGAA